MIDFGVINAFRHTLMDDATLQASGMNQRIHVNASQKTNGIQYPCILIELEEIWTSLKLGGNSGFAKLRLKASTYSQMVSSKESLCISEHIRRVIDGQTLEVGDGKKATVRLSNSVIDMPSSTKPLTVQQYFDVLIR
jgi:endonuclease YncB( thermonuclease family)